MFYFLPFDVISLDLLSLFLFLFRIPVKGGICYS